MRMKTHKGKLRSRHPAGNSSIKPNMLRGSNESEGTKALQKSSAVVTPLKHARNIRSSACAAKNSRVSASPQKHGCLEFPTGELAVSAVNADHEVLRPNFSTPRRKKTPLVNLYSDLSPKGIGFSTPKSSPILSTPSFKDTGPITRKKALSAGLEVEKDKKIVYSKLLISSAEATGYIRRNNKSNFAKSPLSGSDSDTTAHRRSFESPIEKLLRKNRLQHAKKTLPNSAEPKEHSQKSSKSNERKELMNIKVKVARVESLEMLHKNGVNTFQIDRHDKLINIDSMLNQDDAKTREAEIDTIIDLCGDEGQCKEVSAENPSQSSMIQITETKDGETIFETIVDLCEEEIYTNEELVENINPSSGTSLDILDISGEKELNTTNDKSDSTSLHDYVSNSDPSCSVGNDDIFKTRKITGEGDSNMKDVIIEVIENTEECVEIIPNAESKNSTIVENVEDYKNSSDKNEEIPHYPSFEIEKEKLSDYQEKNELTECKKLTSHPDDKDNSNPDFNNQFTTTVTKNSTVSISEKIEGDVTPSHVISSDMFEVSDKNEENSTSKDSAICGDYVVVDIENSKGVSKLSCESNVNEVIKSKEDANGKREMLGGDMISVNSPSSLSTDSAKGSSANGKREMLGGDMISVNSPSSLSTDSAKGSSVTNDILWVSFSTGDIFWGKIYSYCYWPCLVCPDPEGKTITTEVSAGRNGVPQVMVHVRFFADNARRNWVKRDNLLPYNGVENYQQKMLEIEEKYGKKSVKYKAFVVSKAKQRLWNQAIEEANIVKNTPIEQRLEKFNEIYENSRLLTKLERKRRQSMYTTLGSTSDIGSLYGSSDNISLRQISSAVKRDRSISPFSPAYSPVGTKSVKRRKLTEDDETVHLLNSTTTYQRLSKEHDLQAMRSSLNQSSLSSTPTYQDEDIFENGEFKTFFKAMKEFVMDKNTDDKLERSLVVAVRNIWALRHINNRQMQARAMECFDQNELGSTILGDTYGSFKRLSNRLRILSLKRSLAKQTFPQLSAAEQVPFSMTPDAQTEDKVKKAIINRPIEEVIDDIFNLDTKYLFRGLGRDPVCKYCLKPGDHLQKCSKRCQSWFHSECIGKSDREKSKKNARKSKPNTNIVTDELVLNRNLSLHITANEIELNTTSQDVPNLNSVQCSNEVPSDNNNDMLATTTTLIECHPTCQECSAGEEPKCAVCKLSRSDLEELVYCNVLHCNNAFHPACCKYWPQSKMIKSKNKIESFRCPSHVCHTCVSDDPKGKFQNISSSKLTKCIKCPATFHTDSTCIPAGSQILTAAYIICPRHSISKSDQKVNVNWCFICVEGGQVVCCETCPTAVHASCLNIVIDSDEGYICEECETGRMPLYGEMVWAKFNNFRWWPAIILPPTEIPQNIMRMAHSPSDFVVRFFGTHDHGWISRRRVYLYLEGDSTEPPKNKTSLDTNYTLGVEEAKRIWEIIKSKKHVQRLSFGNKQKLHPQPYVKIKSNRAVSPLKLHIDLEKVSKCDCDKEGENPCGPESNCLNRVLYHECNPKLCPAGDRCQNQMFESRISPKLEVVYMKERGFGLVCREPISAGTFVIEYVGEVINHDEFKQRMTQKSIDRDENFYFLSLEKDYIIDAGPKGNLARFMNHSCDPNCETQKWSVNGLNRVGLFAIMDIPADTELTFNYHWDDLLGCERKPCYCGAAKCAGQIGKLKEAKSKEEPKAINKNKTKASKKLDGKPLKRLQKKNHVNVGKKLKNITKSVVKRSKTADASHSNNAIFSSNEEPAVLSESKFNN